MQEEQLFDLENSLDRYVNFVHKPLYFASVCLSNYFIVALSIIVTRDLRI